MRLQRGEFMLSKDFSIYNIGKRKWGSGRGMLDWNYSYASVFYNDVSFLWYARRIMITNDMLHFLFSKIISFICHLLSACARERNGNLTTILPFNKYLLSTFYKGHLARRLGYSFKHKLYGLSPVGVCSLVGEQIFKQLYKLL